MNWFENKTIVVPWDFSDLARDALHTARQMVAGPSRLHGVFVSPPLVGADPAAVWGSLDEQQIRDQSVANFRQATARTGDLAGVNFEVRFGDPGSEIVRFAEEVSADLIVMSSHGRSGLERLMIGSVAERVVRLAHCPVLILRRSRPREL